MVKRGDYPNAKVGEIDTSAPFQSVKDAVNLFGKGALSGEKLAIKKMKAHSAERVLAKETQLHLAQKELKKLKERLNLAECTKCEAIDELEKARQTADYLNQKLKTINEIKAAEMKATEAAKVQAKQLEEANNGNLALNSADQQQKLENAREQYLNALEELNDSKQELTKLLQSYDASLEAKTRASKQFEEAEDTVKVNKGRARELCEGISATKETIDQVQQATMEAKQDLANMLDDKNVQRGMYEASLKDSTKILQETKREFDTELIKNLETQLAEKMSEICNLQKELEDAKALDSETLRSAKESLQNVLQEDSVLQQLVDSLKIELEVLKKEHAELREKQVETESAAGKLHVRLRKSKSELENRLADEAKTGGVSDEILATLNQISSETENARSEAEELKIKAEELEKEAESTRDSLEEAEKLLKIALEEAEQAKAAEESALQQIKIISEKTNAKRSSTSESDAKITLSSDEFKSLEQKVGESDKVTALKLAAATAQVEAVKAGENEALKKLEATQKEIETLKTATQEALKRAEMAEAAKKAVEGELRRWRERERKKAAEIATMIRAETQAQAQIQLPPKYSPIRHKTQKQKSEQSKGARKTERPRVSLSKKSLSGIFQRKKSQIDAGLPSFHPGEALF